MLIHDYRATVDGCSFYDDLATGGGAATLSRSNFTVRNCLFVRNAASGGGVGGALYGNPAGAGSGTIEECTFCGNSQQWTASGAAAVRLSVLPFGGGSFSLRNNIIAGSVGSAAIELFSGTLTSSCNVFWDNMAGDVVGFTLASTDRVVDPQFCDVTLDDYTLHEASPCLPANSVGCGQIGAFGQGCGSVSLEPTTWAKIKVMYR
jgi:hypothetical protein